MIAAIAERLGTLHILINNAGIQDGAAFVEMTFAQWRRVIDVNLHGHFLCAREAVKELQRRGMQPDVSRSLGKIIFMSSVHQTIPWACEARRSRSCSASFPTAGSVSLTTLLGWCSGSLPICPTTWSEPRFSPTAA